MKDKLIIRSKISLKKLDSFAETLSKDPIGKLELLFGLVRMVSIFAYIYVRGKLVETEIEIQKNKQEQSQKLSARQEINEEDLDGK